MLTYSSISHLGIDSLELNTTKEVGADDILVDLYESSSSSPTDPDYNKQWALQDLDNNADINIAEGWREYLLDSKAVDPNGPSVTVAVIDTGVDYTHHDLKDVMWTNPREIAGNGLDDDGNGIVDDVHGADFTTSSNGTGDPIDRHSHGTHCSGIIHGKENNGRGIAGVTSFTQEKVKIMAVKGLSDDGSGTAAGLLSCLNYAIANGATISSNSWGGGTLTNAINSIWSSVLRNNPNHLFVAAAGNSNKLISDNSRIMTCGMKEPNLLCVASSTINDGKSSFSNHGKEYVHVFAPGSAIYSTVPNNRYEYKSGTSMACPYVSGLAALIRSMRGNLSGGQVRELIESNVETKTAYANFVSSSGLINAGKTIKALKGDSTNPGDES